MHSEVNSSSRLPGDNGVRRHSNSKKTPETTSSKASELNPEDSQNLSQNSSAIFRAKSLLGFYGQGKQALQNGLETIVDYFARPKGDDPNNEKIYQTLLKVLKSSYKNHELAESKAETLKALSLGSLSRVFFGFGPFFMKNIFGGSEAAADATKAVQEKMWDFMQPALLSGGAYLSGSFVATLAGDRQAQVVEAFSNALNARIAKALIYKDLEFNEQRNITELNTIIQKGKSSQESLLRHSLSTFGPSSFGLAVNMLGLSYIHPVLLAVAPINIGLLKVLNGKRHQKLRETQAKQNDHNEEASRAIEAIKKGLEEIKTSSNSAALENVLVELGKQAEAEVKEQSVQTNWTQLRASFPTWATKLSTIAISGALMAYGEIDHGELLASFLYSENMSYSFDAMQAIYYKELPKLFENIKRMEDYLDSLDPSQLPDSEEEKLRKPVSELDSHDISIRGLSFNSIHKNLDLEVNPGDFITLVGPNGSGKSTLFKLLLGLYQADEGSISIGGHDIKDLKRHGPESIYSHLIGYGRQDPAMLDGFSLRENLTLGRRETISDEKIIEVLESLGMHDFIDRLDEKNIVPSGGQLMKIGLARALIKDPKILLLDEPSNDIDAASKEALFRAIDERRAADPEMIVITISHDPEICSRDDVKIVDLSEINKQLV